MDFQNSEIRHVFDNYQPKTKQALLNIRQWIFDIAKNTDQIGQVEECLKWGEPSYVTGSPKSGTTLRVSQLKSNPAKFGLFVHCQTSLIEEFRVAYPDFKYDKSRGVIFDSSKPLQTDAIKQFIFLALTYHCRKTE